MGHFPVCGLVDSAIPQVTGGGGDQEGTLEGWESRDLASEWGHNVPLDKKPRLSVPSFMGTLLLSFVAKFSDIAIMFSDHRNKKVRNSIFYDNIIISI